MRHEPTQNLVYDPDAESYRLTQPISDDVTVDLVRAVADLSGTDPADMDPVYGQFDPDALEDLYESLLSRQVTADGRIVVPVADHWASIEGDGTIRIYPPDDPGNDG